MPNPTFIGLNGFRYAKCPGCGGVAPVTSEQDDTRWRYGLHAGKSGDECPVSFSLIPRGEPPVAEPGRFAEMAKQIPLRGCRCSESEPDTCYEHNLVAAAIRAAAAPAPAEPLRKLLEPFAKYVDLRGELMPDGTFMDSAIRRGPTLGDCRAIKAALAALPEPK